MTPNLTGQLPGQKPDRRLNIRYQLNAQSAVLIKKDGIEYAIVSDDNYAHLDPYWRAMYDSSNYFYTPMVTGTVKKVAVGGKLGIVKDPFGAAEYLGATLPYDGYGIVNLSLSEDGKVLLGQFKGGYSGNLFSPYAGMPLPNTNAAWNVDNLLDAALAQPAEDRLSKHINLPPDTLLSLPTHPGQPVGTYFDDALPALSVEGRMGDIIEVDLKRLVAQSLGMQDLLTTNGLKDFELDAADVFAYADDYTAADGIDAITPFTLVTVAGEQNHDLYSRNGAQTADFATTGRMYLAPKLTTQDIVLPNGERISSDIKKLRNGERISVDKQATLNFSFKMKDANGDWITKHTSVTVTAKDIPQLNTFFGDRPLDNPGYSESKLMNGVAANSTNDVLDVYRVEQRLAYLGFPAMYTGNPRPTVDNNVIQNFTVDGWFGGEESAALKLFEKVVRYESSGDNTKFNNNANGADGMIESSQTDPKRALTLQWLNAYNAPHWMQFFAATPNGTYPYSDSNANLTGWVNKQLGNLPNTTSPTNIELYGTSWMYDLMAAAQYAPDALRGTPIVDAQGNITGYTPRNSFWFNGATDANYGFTPNWNPQGSNGNPMLGQHATHDLGMAFDLGVSGYISNLAGGAQSDPTDSGNNAQTLANIVNQPDGWSIANAVSDSALLVSKTTPLSQKDDQISALRDFLSLYALTQTDGQAALNGHIVNTAATSADKLFGGMITGVHIGDAAVLDANGNVKKPLDANPYPSINAILRKLGIDTSPVNGHQNHFHIYLKPPTPQDLPDNLMSDAAASDTAVTSVNTDTQSLLEYALALIEGEELMFIMDVPAMLVQQTPIVLAQATTPAAGTTPQPDYILQTCGETESTGDPRSAIRTVDPAYMLKNYLYVASNGQKIVDLTSIKNITLLEGTTHGKIFAEVDNSGLTSYHYDPTPNYIGNDQAVFLAEFEGKVYKIVLELHVFMGATPGDFGQSTCPEPQLIKVNKPQKGSSLIDLNATTFAALEGGALGQTTGHTITLDDNANGYTWYIDLTPGLNEEFLPTSNPYEWVAKPGSEAEGKMDLLTVLLHEAAHSLGLDHAADAHALMAPTLQPGVRRLPSPELLAELQQRSNDDLLADALTPALSQRERENPAPAPLPLGIGFTAFWAGRMRKTGFGYVFESSPDGVQRNPGDDSPHYAPLHAGYGVNGVRYEVAPNPTLLNTEFAGNTGWNTAGQVTFANGTAVLTESPVAQTRLNQLFTLGDHDRFLRFTLDNVNASPATPSRSLSSIPTPAQSFVINAY